MYNGLTGIHSFDSFNGGANLKDENRDMTFSEVTEGVSKSGMQNYLEYLKLEVIDKIVAKLRDTDDFETKINNGWQGQARDDFFYKFESSINTAINDIYKEFSNLADRLSDLYQEYMRQDENMID